MTMMKTARRQNELYSEVWKLFSQSSTDAPFLLPCAMLPRQARGTHKKNSLPNLLHSSFWDVVHDSPSSVAQTRRGCLATSEPKEPEPFLVTSSCMLAMPGSLAAGWFNRSRPVGPPCQPFWPPRKGRRTQRWDSSAASCRLSASATAPPSTASCPQAD